MVWIPGGTFKQGAPPQDTLAMGHERPEHTVTVDGFFMKTTEITNLEFKKFVDQTGYLTVAERPLDWEQLKKQLPPGTPKPHDSILKPGSLVFYETQFPVSDYRNISQWWRWVVGASWKHPKGPNSSIDGKDDHPVVHISYEDAMAYCEWARVRLPTEAEWEYAAAGGLTTKDTYPWGSSENELHQKANTWTGTFPTENTVADGYEGKAPVASYDANAYGLFDMSGNVWEWTSDWYNTNYYREQTQNTDTLWNPLGAKTHYNPASPYQKEKIIKGGSFLCHASYCASYRISARMANTLDSAQEHLGFRTVVDLDMIKEQE